MSFLAQIQKIVRQQILVNQPLVVLFVILRKIDLLLAGTKALVLQKITEKSFPQLPRERQNAELFALTSYRFFNTSPFDLATIAQNKNRQLQNLKIYLGGFSDEIREFFRDFKIDEKLENQFPRERQKMLSEIAKLEITCGNDILAGTLNQIIAEINLNSQSNKEISDGLIALLHKVGFMKTVAKQLKAHLDDPQERQEFLDEISQLFEIFNAENAKKYPEIRAFLLKSLNEKLPIDELKNYLLEDFQNDFTEIGVPAETLAGTIEKFIEILLKTNDATRDYDGVREIIVTMRKIYFWNEFTPARLKNLILPNFECFLKKLCILKAIDIPAGTDNREPTLKDFANALGIGFLRHEHQRIPAFDRMANYYRGVFEFRNKFAHTNPILPVETISSATHATLAIYLYATYYAHFRQRIS